MLLMRYPQSLERRIQIHTGQHLCRRMFSYCNRDTIFKAYLLVAMCLNLTFYNLITAYSRQITKGPRYFTTTVVFLAELLKLAVSLIMLLYSCEWHVWKLKILLETEMLQKPMEFAKLVIPAGLYALQNNLVYIALSNLDPATYQVTSNLKLVTTVIFHAHYSSSTIQILPVDCNTYVVCWHCLGSDSCRDVFSFKQWTLPVGLDVHPSYCCLCRVCWCIF
ncbi:UDP-N-acetylglucosamine transporter-like [Limulus polyphemus]|uniref:UDP-N-acetylglucosamine transporter-like n=1 Tax=Limulus polyphemus TaxID=6850 RepID=A0ABM1T2I2_LIMPO|nr:UDP-N-acetylglucosamine transporter-like [Limulus polyphemus]